MPTNTEITVLFLHHAGFSRPDVQWLSHVQLHDSLIYEEWARGNIAVGKMEIEVGTEIRHE